MHPLLWSKKHIIGWIVFNKMTINISPIMAEKRERKISNVINEYGNRLFRFIRGRVPNNADAEDITQEVWYQLSRVVELDSIEQISGWLFFLMVFC